MIQVKKRQRLYNAPQYKVIKCIDRKTGETTYFEDVNTATIALIALSGEEINETSLRNQCSLSNRYDRAIRYKDWDFVTEYHSNDEIQWVD